MESKHSGWVRVLIFIIPYFLVVGGFQILAYSILGLDINESDVDRSILERTVISYFTLIGTIIIIYIFLKFQERKSFSELGFDTTFIKKDMIYGLLTGFIIITASVIILFSINNIMYSEADFNLLNLLLSFLLYMSVSISEEVLVRGYILRNLMLSLNKYLALIISSAIFSLIHAANPAIETIGFINIFLSGILMGGSYIYTRNLWYPIALHFSWNFFQAIFGFNVSGLKTPTVVNITFPEFNILNGGTFGLEGSILVSILSLLAILIVLKYYKQRSANFETS